MVSDAADGPSVTFRPRNKPEYCSRSPLFLRLSDNKDASEERI